MHGRAGGEPEPGDGIARDLGQEPHDAIAHLQLHVVQVQLHVAHVQLHDHVIGCRVRRESPTTVPGSTLCRLSPSGCRVARMTSRAGMRTRTFAPAADARSAASSVPPSKRELDQSAVRRRRPRHARVEDAAQSDGVAQPGQIGTAHQRRRRAPLATPLPRSSTSTCVASRTTSSKSCVTSTSGMSQRPAQLVDLVLETATHGAIDGGERLVEEQHRRLARQRSRQGDTLAFAARELVRPPI